MSDERGEEQGFTFVDKRGTQSEAPAAEPAPAPASEAIFAEEGTSDAPEEIGDTQGPPDIYSVVGYCISLLSSEAWQKLGLLADPATGEATLDLAQAKVAIDAAGDLAKHLEGAPAEFVPDALKRDLQTLLRDLRLNFVSQQNK